MPIFVFFVISELRLGSNERYENSTFYGSFRFLIFILVFKGASIKDVHTPRIKVG